MISTMQDIDEAEFEMAADNVTLATWKRKLYWGGELLIVLGLSAMIILGYLR